MNLNYTQYNSDSIYQFGGDDDTSEAIDFLKDPSNFRAFHQGLSEIIKKKCLVPENATPCDMAEILYDRLTKIGSSLSLETITTWLTGEICPNIEYRHRNQIYEICFSLNLSLDETKWFFHHVYYDRAFNCHTINDSVYYFCFKNKLTYKDAIQIIEQIEKNPNYETSQTKTSNYTIFVQQRLENIESIEELISFLSQNKANFISWNESAYNELKNIETHLLPTKNAKSEIEKIKRKIKNGHSFYSTIPKPKDQKEWGLVMKEILFDVPDEAFLDIIEGKNICSGNFLLEQILGMKLKTEKGKNRFIDEEDIPDIVKNNFPSRKTMSDVLSEDKVIQTKSYDSIRKMIILLYFYQFWGEIRISNQDTDSIDTPLSDVFIEEMDDLLYSCGYESIYAGNPYDWIFLCSAQAEDPLLYFRELISYILVE